MSENLIGRLLELLDSPGPVNWKLAAEVARNMAGPAQAVDPELAQEYRELARTARLHVAAASVLDLGPLLEAEPLDRRSWAETNLRSFRYLVEPLAQRLSGAPAGPLDALVRPAMPILLGLQAGLTLGLLSQRVLGQFDVGLPSGEAPRLLLVVPNVEAFASEYHLDARQVRLWVALHEVTHQAEFAVPWVRPHFGALIEELVEGIEVDPAVLGDRLQGFQDPEELERLLQDPAGLAGLLSGPRQQETVAAVQAFMAVMEGYGEFVMDRAAPALLPELPRMREAVDRRRAEASPGEQMLQRLLGLELKLRQYRMGAAFCAEVERRWGAEALAELWKGPERLPSPEELEDPVAWAARVLLPELSADGEDGDDG